MKEIVRRAIELLKDKNYSRVCLNLPEINWDELRRRIIEILTDKRGELGIPNTEVKLCSAENTWLETARKNRS